MPYAFAFADQSNKMDFVLISVHLKPGGGSSNVTRRSEELTALATWIGDNDATEKDFMYLA